MRVRVEFHKIQNETLKRFIDRLDQTEEDCRMLTRNPLLPTIDVDSRRPKIVIICTHVSNWVLKPRGLKYQLERDAAEQTSRSGRIILGIENSTYIQNYHSASPNAESSKSKMKIYHKDHGACRKWYSESWSSLASMDSPVTKVCARAFLTGLKCSGRAFPGKTRAKWATPPPKIACQRRQDSGQKWKLMAHDKL